MENAGYDMGYAMGGAFAALGAFIFVLVLIGIVAYILFSIGLMKLAQNKGIANAWLAWIPFGNMYILGMIVKEVSLGSFVIPKLELILPIACVVYAIVNDVNFIGGLVGLALLVLNILVYYKLYSMYRPDSAVLFTILSFLLALVWLFVFIIRDDKEVAPQANSQSA